MWYGPDEDRIRQLERDLYKSRRAVVMLLPPAIQELVEEYYGIETHSEVRDWESRLVDGIVELAWSVEKETIYSQERAYCPLCRTGSAGPYVEGFVVPGGLRMHLLGEGNARPCNVLSAVRELAREYWWPRVREAEERERSQLEAERDIRRQTEDQWITDPRSSPKLLDEGLWGSEARDPDSLRWAEDRLRELGFSEIREKGVVQFTKAQDEMIVYGDPRQQGRITFHVYREQQVNKPKSRKRWIPDHASVHILDSWRHDLGGKLGARLEKASESLGGRKK